MASPFLCLVLLLGAVLVLAAAVDDATAASPDPRVAELQARQKSARDGVIRLNDQTFKEFLKGTEPRPYSVLLFFDASMLRDNQELQLPKLREEFGLVAKAAAKQLGDDVEEPIFFADVEFKQSEGLFRSLGVSTLPHVRFFPPGKGSKGVEIDWTQFPRNLEGFASFVKSKGYDIGDVEKPPAISKQQMAFVGLALVVAAPFLLRLVVTKKTFLHDSRYWCAGALAIYFFSVSGGMYNIIRNMPMFVPDRQKPGKFVYFLQGNNGQFGAEGFTIGALYTAVGLMAAFLTHVLPRVPSKLAQRIVAIACMAASVYAVRQVVSFEVWKSGYWIHGFYPRSWR